MLLFIVLAKLHRAMMGTSINRRISFAAFLAVGAMFVVLIGGWLGGAPASAAPTLFYPLWTMIGSMLTICLERRLWPVAAVADWGKQRKMWRER